MTREEMDAVLDEHFRAEATHDLDAAVATLTEDAEHDVVGFPVAVVRGREAIRQRYEQLFNDFADERVEQVRRRHGSDFLVDECVVHARATGAPLGIPGGGRQVSFRMLHVCEFRDGKISRENVWMDVAALLAQLNGQPAGV